MGAQLGTVVALLVALAGQQAPPRDAPAQPPFGPPQAGTSSISGVVVAADNGLPVKRAMVMIVGYGSLPTARPAAPGGTVGAVASSTLVVTSGFQSGGAGGRGNQPPWRTPKTTDDAGRFEFTDLPAGQFTLNVMPQSGFVALRTPQRVMVKDGDRATLAIKLDRTGAITGRILDESGDPLPRARVSALRHERAGGRPRQVGSGAMTDDMGQFRLFDLAPGEYSVGATFQQPTFPSQPAGELGFATTYFPGTAVLGDSQRVTVKSAQDTPGVDFSLVRVPMGSVSGTVRDAAGQLLTFEPRTGPPGTNVSVMLASEQDGAGFSRGAGLRPDGTFQIDGVAPGKYQLVASLNRGQVPEGQREGAIVPITVNGDDQRVDVRMNRGATISGRVVVEGSRPLYPQGITPPAGMGIARISVRNAPDRPFFGSMPQPVQVGEDGEFQLTGVRGTVILSAFAMGTAVLESITQAGADLLAKPLELRGTEQLGDVVVTLTTDTGRLEGIVTKNGTDPAIDASVMVFPDDPDKWFQGSPFVFSTRTMGEMPAGMPPPRPGMPLRTPGSFTSRNLLPGRYYVVATEVDGPAMPTPDRETLEKLRTGATSVTVTVGATARVQLTLRRPN